MKRTAFSTFVLFLFAMVAFAQDPKAKDKDAPVVLPADKSILKSGGSPLSNRVLVQRPAAVKGALSWTLESRTHRGQLNSAALSPDGKILATGGLDGAVRLWDTEKGEFARIFVGHDYYVYGLAFSPDGKYLASSGSFDATVRIWEVATGLPIRVLKGVPEYVGPVVWTPDGKGVVAGGATSGWAYLFDATNGKVKQKAEIGRPIKSVTVHPEGRYAIVAATGQAPVQFNFDTGKLGKRFGDADAEYQGLAISPDGNTLAAATDKDTRLIDTLAGTTSKKLENDGQCVAWTADGKRFAVSGLKGTVLFDSANNSKVNTFPPGFVAMGFTPNGGRIIGVSNTLSGCIDIEPNKLAWQATIAAGGDAIYHANRSLVTGLGTNSLTLHDPVTVEKLKTLAGHAAPVTAFGWSPDGKLLATASADKTVRIWDPTAGESKRTFSEHTAELRCLAWNPDGKQIATGSADGTVLVWDSTTLKVIHKPTAHAKGVYSVAWAQMSKALATGGADAQARVYDASGKMLKEIDDAEAVLSVALSQDGRLLATGPQANVPRIWNVTTGKELYELPVGSPQHVMSMAVSSQGGTLAVGRANHQVQLVDMRAVKMGKTFDTQSVPIMVAWSPASTFIVASCQDRVTRFFDPAGGPLPRGNYLLEGTAVIAISESGHYRSSESEPAGLVAVVQTDKGQDTLTLGNFAAKFGWKNNPANAKPGK